MIFELVQTGSGFALLTQSAFSDELSVWAVIKGKRPQEGNLGPIVYWGSRAASFSCAEISSKYSQ